MVSVERFRVNFRVKKVLHARLEVPRAGQRVEEARLLARELLAPEMKLFAPDIELFEQEIEFPLLPPGPHLPGQHREPVLVPEADRHPVPAGNLA
jgi:hypothetical protein